MVTGDSPLKQLFRPEEVELLVCGSKVLLSLYTFEIMNYPGDTHMKCSISIL